MKILREELATVTGDAIEDAVMSVLSDEGGAAGLEPIEDALTDLEDDDVSSPDESIEDLINGVPGVKRHTDGDYIDTTQLESRVIRITKQQLRRLIEQVVIDKTVPEHFGSGENIDVYGYDTKHFDICRSAVTLFEDSLADAEFLGTEKMIVEAAKMADKIFAIEKRVVSKGYSELEECEEAVELHDKFKECVKNILVEDYTDKIGFMKMHVKEITKREE